VRLENEFEVQASPEAAWELLLDVPRVVPCMPGAHLQETIDERSWVTVMNVKLGPISLTFLTDVVREEVDEAAKRIRLRADGRDTKGRGRAKATIDSLVTTSGDGARVAIVTDLQLSGPAGQFGGPVVKAVAGQLTKRFAACLAEQLSR
jgi:carbon monoxide dehydrogenase subunit G